MKSDCTLDPIQVTSVGSLVNLEGDGVGIYAALKIYLWKSEASISFLTIHSFIIPR